MSYYVIRFRPGAGCGAFLPGSQPAEGASDAKELRASAPGRLRPANRCAIDSVQKARSRAVGLLSSCTRMQPSAWGKVADAFDIKVVRTSPQPSGRACDVEKQPSARGRLRAADVCDVAFVAKHLGDDRRLRAAGRYATDPDGNFTTNNGHGLPVLTGRVCQQPFPPQPTVADSSLRRTARSGPAGRELRAFAGRSCGPRGLLRPKF